ncbi:unnamed protein product, partial [Vitis vinifera]
MWSGNLIDIRELSTETNKEDIYIRGHTSEPGKSGEIDTSFLSPSVPESHTNQKTKKIVIILVISNYFGILTLGLAVWFLFLKKRTMGTELPLFDLPTVATATDNFSNTNMIGAGGFGPVYKGNLPEGVAVAVKRLSKNSAQGVQEFNSEVALMAKLQHKNLVRLLGCCVQGEERILLYEYMPNKSLDYFIFGLSSVSLSVWISFTFWSPILCSVVFSSIHTSNGYMSPEYVIDGHFSIKSDVFSFGVLLLEIVSGKKNRGFSHPYHHHNLLGHAWLLWEQNKALELMDACLEDSCVASQVLRCIQVGLLCVQNLPADRPAMSSVIFMLGNEGATLPQPKHPGFFTERSSVDTDTMSGKIELHSENEVTISKLKGRWRIQTSA